MDDLSIARATLPTDPDERDTPDSPPRKRARSKPGPGTAESPPAEAEAPAHDGKLDIVV